jgi:hypothetical protein
MPRMSACTVLELLSEFDSLRHCVACHNIFLPIVRFGAHSTLLTRLVLYPLLFYVSMLYQFVCIILFFLSAVQCM